MNRNDRNANQGQRNRKGKQGKRVTFETQSQQWRVNRTNNPNQNRVNKPNIKNGRNALRRAQAAYYGEANKSPLLPKPPVTQPKNKLPVHARLGNVSNNVRSRLTLNKNNTPKKTVAQLVAEKRAIKQKMRIMAQKLRQKNVPSMKINPNPGFNKNGARNARKRGQFKMQNLGNLSATDLSVSVANDFALQEQLNSSIGSVERVRQLPKSVLHSRELNPRFQSEIAVIQQRNRFNQQGPFLNSGINPADAINGLNNKVTRIFPTLGGYTTIINEPKLTLHERFSML